jgi:K(+)-stimulated pyrophosphate-energized sodium pump
MEGTGKPEYGKCVAISTKAALREMMLPGLLTIGFPIAIVLLGMLIYPDNNQLVAEMLGGYMAGVTVSGVLWAVFQNNAGGAWDNAKKSFEAGVMINGEMTYKGSDAHKAAVTGDTVGDPFKDTSGPSMNILIKLTCLIGLVIAPILGGHTEVNADRNTASTTVVNEQSAVVVNESKDEVQIERTTDGNGNVKAVVRKTTYEDGNERTVNETFDGTEQEVNAQIADFWRR